MRLFGKITLGLVLLVVGLFFFIWMITPFLARHFIAEALTEYNIELTESSFISYNPFTSSLKVREVGFHAGNQRHLILERVDLSMHLHQLLFDRVYVSKFALKGLEMNINIQQDKQRIAGFVIESEATTPVATQQMQAEQEQALATASAEPAATQVENADTPQSLISLVVPVLTFEDVTFNIQYEGQPVSLIIDRLELTRVNANEASQIAHLSIEGRLNEAPFTFSAHPELNQGMGQVNTHFSLDSLQLTPFNPILKSLGVDMALAGALSLSTDLTAQLKQQKDLHLDAFTLSTEQFQISTAPWIYAADQQTIEIKDTQISDLDQAPKIDLPHLDIALSNSRLALDTSDNLVAQFGAFTTQLSLEGEGEDFSLASDALIFNELKVMQTPQEPESMVNISELRISSVALTPSSVEIDQIALENLAAGVHILADGQIKNLVDFSILDDVEAEGASSSDKPSDNPSNEPETSSESAAEVANTESEQASEFKIKLNQLAFIPPTKIVFTDESVKPTYSRNFDIETLTVGPVDSAQPELATSLKLKGKSEEYAFFEIDGAATPLATKQNGFVKGDIKEISLPGVSSYVRDALGFELQSGQLDTHIDVTVEEDQLDGKTQLNIRGLGMKTLNEEDSQVENGKAMPLNVALGMLKDGQGNLNLGVPISGDISDPNFGLQNFMGLVIKKAVMSQTKSYLLNTFVPYASVVSVALVGADYLLKVKFEPYYFEAGQTTPDVVTQKEYLDVMTKLLIERENLQIQTCALSVPADIGIVDPTQKLDENQVAQLKALGKTRQSEFKSYLVEQGVPSAKILFCATEIDSGDSARPRIKVKTN